MSNTYVALPVAVGNGAGAAVDVSTFGVLKTIVATGNAQVNLTIEFNNNAIATAGSWQSLATLQNQGYHVANVACRWMRVRSSSYNVNVGGTSSVNVGGTDDGSQFVSLPVAVGNGAGAAVDVSALEGTFKTVQVGGSFQGTVIVEVSEDGNTEWAQPFSFGSAGAQSMQIIARFMRTRRVGVPVINPGLPVVNVGFALPTPGGGSGFVPATRTLTGTAPIEIDGSNAPQDLSADRTISIVPFDEFQDGAVLAGGAPSNVLRGNNTWSTIAQLTADLDLFTTLLRGLVPPSVAAANFLRGDGTWNTEAEVTADLDLFTALLQGLVPASGGGTANFLRADGAWAPPAVPAFDTILTPAAITFGAAFDNWNPGALGQNTLIRCTTDGSSRAVRGLVGGVNGITVTLLNVNASPAIVENWQAEDPAATPANRFRTAFVSGGCTYYYDGLLSRWALLTGSP